MATFTENAVRKSITIYEEEGVTKLTVNCTAYVGTTATRSANIEVALSSLSEARQSGILSLMQDAETLAKQRFEIP